MFVAVLPSELVGQTTILTHEDVSNRVSEIAEISDDNERLQAYDEFAKSVVQFLNSGNNSSDSPSLWNISYKRNPLDDSNLATATLEAVEGPNKYGDYPHLIVRCRISALDVIFSFGQYFAESNTNADIRIGDGEVRTRRMTLASNNEAMFYTGDSKAFLNSLSGQNRLVVKTYPYNENPITSIFNLSGIDKVIEATSACN